MPPADPVCVLAIRVLGVMDQEISVPGDRPARGPLAGAAEFGTAERRLVVGDVGEHDAVLADSKSERGVWMDHRLGGDQEWTALERTERRFQKLDVGAEVAHPD